MEFELTEAIQQFIFRQVGECLGKLFDRCPFLRKAVGALLDHVHRRRRSAAGQRDPAGSSDFIKLADPTV